MYPVTISKSKWPARQSSYNIIQPSGSFFLFLINIHEFQSTIIEHIKGRVLYPVIYLLFQIKLTEYTIFYRKNNHFQTKKRNRTKSFHQWMNNIISLKLSVEPGEEYFHSQPQPWFHLAWVICWFFRKYIKWRCSQLGWVWDLVMNLQNPHRLNNTIMWIGELFSSLLSTTTTINKTKHSMPTKKEREKEQLTMQ